MQACDATVENAVSTDRLVVGKEGVIVIPYVLEEDLSVSSTSTSGGGAVTPMEASAISSDEKQREGLVVMTVDFHDVENRAISDDNDFNHSLYPSTFCSGYTNRLEKVTRTTQDQFQMVLEEQSRSEKISRKEKQGMVARHDPEDFLSFGSNSGDDSLNSKVPIQEENWSLPGSNQGQRSLKSRLSSILDAVTEWITRQMLLCVSLKTIIFKAYDDVRTKVVLACPVVLKWLMHFGNLMLLLSVFLVGLCPPRC
ncbi:hypothetical protein VNO77_17723 [Canavalia gladiata]|uniref:Uncharacterized protein n=1 Tax=Canavalia gladiata TaxID=3824 RepID=A0AAN9LNB0_CANGL